MLEGDYLLDAANFTLEYVALIFKYSLPSVLLMLEDGLRHCLCPYNNNLAASSETVSLNSCKLRRFRSTCSCAKFHPRLSNSYNSYKIIL